MQPVCDVSATSDGDVIRSVTLQGSYRTYTFRELELTVSTNLSDLLLYNQDELSSLKVYLSVLDVAYTRYLISYNSVALQLYNFRSDVFTSEKINCVKDIISCSLRNNFYVM